MDQQLVASMEQMLLATFPPLETAEAAGMTVGSSLGVTGRANSAMITGEIGDPGAAIRWASDWLLSRGQAPLFRLSPLAPAAMLELLGPEKAYNSTSCMHLTLDAASASANADGPAASGRIVTITAGRPDDWISEGDDRRKAEVLALMQKVEGQIAWAMIRDESAGAAPVAAGRGVVVDGWLCIQAMYTEPAVRGQGLATDVLRALHRWAVTAGASDAFLNVLVSNDAATSIYERHGYAHVYDYTYVGVSTDTTPVPQDC